MGGRNFEKSDSRRNIARRGFDPIGGGMPSGLSSIRKQPSKADQRAFIGDLLAAVTEITRVFECRPCGTQFRAKQAIEPTEPMLCRKCGRPV